MAKLLSSTGKSTAEINPDGNALIFKSVATGQQVFWPLKDWGDLQIMVNSKSTDNNEREKTG